MHQSVHIKNEMFQSYKTEVMSPVKSIYMQILQKSYLRDVCIQDLSQIQNLI